MKIAIANPRTASVTGGARAVLWPGTHGEPASAVLHSRNRLGRIGV